MSKEKLKVNVTFPLSVPVLTDSAGRRRSIPDQVAGYINDFMTDIRIAMECERSNPFGQDGVVSGPSEKDIELYEKMSSNETKERLIENQQRAENINKDFNKAKDKECRKLYDISWNEFRILDWEEQEAIRELNGVYWDHHRSDWRKK